MSIDNPEITINLDTKRLIAITILAIISVYTLYTYSVALLAFIAPYPGDEPIQVVAATYDQYGVPETSFTQGSTITVKGTITRATGYYNVPLPGTSYTNFDTDITCLIFITIKDPNNEPVMFYQYIKTLSPGEIVNYQKIYLVPSDGAIGSYKVSVIIWNAYLPYGVHLAPKTSVAGVSVS